MLTGLELYTDPENPDQIWSQVDDGLWLSFNMQVKMPRREWLKCQISNKILVLIVHQIAMEIAASLQENIGD